MRTDAMKRKQIACCKQYQDWTPEQWSEVLFSNESTLVLLEVHHNLFVALRMCPTLTPRFTINTETS